MQAAKYSHKFVRKLQQKYLRSRSRLRRHACLLLNLNLNLFLFLNSYQQLYRMSFAASFGSTFELMFT